MWSIPETADATEDDLQARMNQLTFVVGTKKLAAMPNWISVSEVMTTSSDAPFLKKAGVMAFDDPRYDKYTDLKRLRAIKNYTYRMDVLERSISSDEVTEIFVRINSLGAKLRSSDLSMAQITAKWRESLKIFEEFQEECFLPSKWRNPTAGAVISLRRTYSPISDLNSPITRMSEALSGAI